MTRSDKTGWAFTAGLAVAAVTSLLTVWTTVVRDDGSAEGYFMVILAAGVGSFAAMFRAAGMARTMLGVAVMHAVLGLLTATAPSTASQPGASTNALLFSGAFSLLWLTSAALFRVADGSQRSPEPSDQPAN